MTGRVGFVGRVLEPRDLYTNWSAVINLQIKTLICWHCVVLLVQSPEIRKLTSEWENHHLW